MSKSSVDMTGQFYIEDGNTWLLVDKSLVAGAWDYTAYSMFADIDPFVTSVCSKRGFDSFLNDAVDHWRDMLIVDGANVPYSMLASLLLDDPSTSLAVAVINLLVEDRTEVADDELADAMHVLHNVTLSPSPIRYDAVIALAKYAYKRLRYELDSRHEEMEEEYTDIPFDRYHQRFDDYKDELMPQRDISFYDDVFDSLPVWARR